MHQLQSLKLKKRKSFTKIEFHAIEKSLNNEPTNNLVIQNLLKNISSHIEEDNVPYADMNKNQITQNSQQKRYKITLNTNNSFSGSNPEIIPSPKNMNQNSTSAMNKSMSVQQSRTLFSHLFFS